MNGMHRRSFLNESIGLGLAALIPSAARAASPRGTRIKFGLVTYQWGRDWDLPTLIRNCAATGALGVELRTTHAHKVEPSLSAAERAEVKKRFADSPVTLVGLGSAEDFHKPDPAAHRKTIETTKAFIKLSHDVGGTGVKVRPNDLPKGIPPEKTIEQIGKTLNEVAAFGADYGQQVRMEVHGGCARLPIIKQIMDVATHRNAAVCWNSNSKWDLEPPGLVANFNLVKDRFGATAHVRPLDSKDYPFPELIKLFVQLDYAGWLLLEAGNNPPDRVAALAEQVKLFKRLVAEAQRA